MNHKNTSEREKTVIFVHIPKTGGLTLTEIAAKNYKRDRIYRIDGRCVQDSVNNLKNLPDEEKRKISFVAGHAQFGLHEHLPQPSTYITMLRDPVERVISSYYYVLSTPNHPFHQDFKKEDSFEDFLESKRFTFLDNGQIRMLTFGWGKIEYGECSREMLETAKWNLKNYFLFGLTERFDESLILFQRKLDWKIPFYLKTNVTKKRPKREQISEKALITIQKHNALELELYDYAIKKFEEDFNQNNIKIITNFYKKVNKLYAQFSSLTNIIKP